MKHTVKVVIPLYREDLSPVEQATLAHNMEVLGKHPVCFLRPEGLDTERVTGRYPDAEIMEVSDNWLGRKRGIQGYNEMMMSKDFYERFADCEYILICHTDAWIFRDELLEWCGKGYDIVAPPWPVRPRYFRFPLKQFVALKKFMAARKGKISRVQMYGRIGNGGLCLRKVEAFCRACDRYASEIDMFNSIPDAMHNEDIFWALVPEEFNYPSVEVALSFAYDLKPRLCHQLNHGQIPMGCHGFMHKSRVGYWRKYIPCTDAGCV